VGKKYIDVLVTKLIISCHFKTNLPIPKNDRNQGWVFFPGFRQLFFH
jgi:hypothetical protein